MGVWTITFLMGVGGGLGNHQRNSWTRWSDKKIVQSEPCKMHIWNKLKKKSCTTWPWRKKKTFLLRKINQPPWKIQCIVSGPSLTVNFFKEFCPEINKTNNIYNCHEKTYTCSWQTDLNNIQNVPVACVMFKKTKDIHLYSQLRTEEENTDNITTLANPATFCEKFLIILSI